MGLQSCACAVRTLICGWGSSHSREGRFEIHRRLVRILIYTGLDICVRKWFLVVWGWVRSVYGWVGVGGDAVHICLKILGVPQDPTWFGMFEISQSFAYFCINSQITSIYVIFRIFLGHIAFLSRSIALFWCKYPQNKYIFLYVWSRQNLWPQIFSNIYVVFILWQSTTQNTMQHVQHITIHKFTLYHTSHAIHNTQYTIHNTHHSRHTTMHTRTQ